MLSDPDFAVLLKRFSLSWEGYRKVRKGVKKRLRRRVGELGLKRFGDYLDLIDSEPAERLRCAQMLTVSISRFLRDPLTWEVIQNEVLPSFKEHSLIRAWCAGCALGQEVYTLRMIYERVKGEGVDLPPLEILATDLNPEYLRKAKEGEYTRSNLAPLPENERKKYFTKLPGKRWFRVGPILREGISWREHDLLSPPPQDHFDLTLMRNNLFTYQQEKEQEAVLNRVITVLGPGGYLIIGAKERLPWLYPELMPHGRVSGIFVKIK